MITVGTSSGHPETGEALPERPKKRIPLMAIPITLSVGLLFGVGYVGNRIFASRTHVTVVATPVGSAPQAVSVVAPAVAGPAVAAAASAPPSSADQRVVSASAGPPPNAVPVSKDPAPVAEPREQDAKPRAEAGTPRPASTPLPTPASTEEITQAQSEGLDLIAPQRGERYLQIAAISSHMVSKFLSDLNRYHLQANVAPGPRDGLVRIVIGPFPDRESITQAKARIEANWPDCFVRLY